MTSEKKMVDIQTAISLFKGGENALLAYAEKSNEIEELRIKLELFQKIQGIVKKWARDINPAITGEQFVTEIDKLFAELTKAKPDTNVTLQP